MRDCRRSGSPTSARSPHFFGHSEAEQELLQAYRSGRMPHAWLIGGSSKASARQRWRTVWRGLCWRILTPIAERAAAASRSRSRRIIRSRAYRGAGAQRSAGARTHGRRQRQAAHRDRGRRRRRTVTFFGSTAGEGGWRVCIVDSVDELNRFGANTLLKILEEPPARSLLLAGQPRARPAVAHDSLALPAPDCCVRCTRTTSSGSGCGARQRSAKTTRLRRAAALAEGSVARAIALFDGPTLALHDGVAALLARLPEIDPGALHALGGQSGRANDGAFETFLDGGPRMAIDAARVRNETAARLARIAMAWETFNQVAADVAVFNLERKPLVFSTFDLLAGLSRA